MNNMSNMETRRDEFSFVLEGELTVEQMGQTVTVRPGGYVAKPRAIMHTFWYAGAEPVRFVEIIAPGEQDLIPSALPPYSLEISYFLTNGKRLFQFFHIRIAYRRQRPQGRALQ